MIEVISIKFKNKGKSYFFSPNGLQIRSGEKVIVETSKGLEIADCCHGNHTVEDTAVVQPLRGVVRLATADDLRVAEINKKREKEAFVICEQKIAEHGLDMKLVDVECNFEGNKTTFFFTSNGRVDFRELVRDLAGIFRNRIELRQIGVRALLLQPVPGGLPARLDQDGQGAVALAQPGQDLRRLRQTDVLPALRAGGL